MSEWIRLASDQHRLAGWRRFSDYAFAADDQVCPLLLAELTQALPYYPLAFAPVKAGDTATPIFQLVALLGFAAGQNLYLDGRGRWLAPYVPSHYRSHPFGLVPAARPGGDGLSLVLAIRDGELFEDPAGPDAMRLFDDDGTPSPTTRQIGEFLHQRLRDLAKTQRLIAQIATLDLIRPWPITWRPDPGADLNAAEQPEARLDGFFAIDEQRLGNLSPEACQSLLRTGALGLAYAQIFSQARLSDLRQRLALKRKPLAPPPPPLIDLDAIFGNNGPLLNFDALDSPADPD